MKKMRKMDEMEMSINLQSIRWSWGITALVLFICFVINIFNKGLLEAAKSPQFIIMDIQILSYLLISIALKKE